MATPVGGFGHLPADHRTTLLLHRRDIWGCCPGLLRSVRWSPECEETQHQRDHPHLNLQVECLRHTRTPIPAASLGMRTEPSPGTSVKLQAPIAALSLFRACAALRLVSNNPLQALAALRPRSAQNTRWQAPHSVPPIACSLQRSASPWPAASFCRPLIASLRSRLTVPAASAVAAVASPVAH